MLRVWVDGRGVGDLDRFRRGSAFVYDPDAPEGSAVSLTMPKRMPSWDSDYGLAPIFEMNLPEGALRARLAREFAKAVGTFDDYDLLSVVGRTQIGRIRYSGSGESLSEKVPFQSIDEILRAQRGGELFDYLIGKFAVHSGVSGVQPKILIRASGPPDARQSLQSATHIVKFWDATEYPQLAANEFFCLQAASRLGFTVPPFRLSDDGGALVIERFDRGEDGSYLGFEDFCVLNGFGTDRKYSGGYETRLFRRTREFVNVEVREKSLHTLFRLFVLNCAIRNGDAHLKNFGVIYRDTQSQVTLAPVYDLVTTAAYLPQDSMALTLGGSTAWPSRSRLVQLGQTYADLGRQKIDRIFEETADVLGDMAPTVDAHFRQTPNPDVGARMLSAWEAGRRSLGRDG